MRGVTGAADARAVRQPSDVLAALLDGSADGIVLCDADGVVTLANPAAVRLVPEIEVGLLAPAPLDAPLDAAPSTEGPSTEGPSTTYGGRVLRTRVTALGDGQFVWYLSDLGNPGESGETPQARRTEFLLEAGRRLSASLNPHRCALAATRLCTAFLSDAAVVFLPPTVRRRMTWLRTGPRGTEEGTLPASAAAQVPGLTDALAGLTHAAGGRQEPSALPGWLLPEGFGPAAHLLVLPLPGSGVPAGAIVLVRHAGRPPFDDDEQVMARDLAARTGAAMSAAMLFQEQSAVNAILTGDLLPPDLPDVEGMRLGGRLRASQQAGMIGGDFYDVYPPEGPSETGISETGSPGPGSPGPGIVERPPLVLLGDVCGKGARAAVLAGQVRHSLRTLLLLESRPERLVELLNRSLLATPSPNSYVTLILAALRAAPGDHVLVDLTVAGHPPPLVLRGDGRVEEAPSHGSILGMLKEITLRPVTLDLAPGEVCLFYSDGITEAFGGPSGREMFGEQRLKDTLATCAGMPVDALVERLEQVSSDWLSGGQQDDRALLAIRAGD